jgi:hypothetical protein
MTTTTKELATTEVVAELVPMLTKEEAKKLSNQIKSASEKFVTSRSHLQDLIEQAYNGQIHEALGTTWVAWFADTVRISVEDEDERKLWSESLGVKGMSQRAIGKVLGVSAATVNRDQKETAAKADESGVPHETPAEKSTGLDGKEYTRPEPKQPEQDEPLDTTAVDFDDDDEPQNRHQAETLRDADETVWAVAAAMSVAFIGATKFDDDVTREAVPKHIKNIRENVAEVNKAVKAASAIWNATKAAKATAPKPAAKAPAKAPSKPATKKTPAKKAPAKRAPVKRQRRPVIPGSDARLHTTITPGATK